MPKDKHSLTCFKFLTLQSKLIFVIDKSIKFHENCKFLVIKLYL